MSTEKPTSPSTDKALSGLKDSINAAMPHAGMTASQSTIPLTNKEILAKTRISHTTLRGVTGKKGKGGRSPDLNTLTKIAECFGVPLPFLLMTPAHWKALWRAIETAQKHGDKSDGLHTSSAPSPLVSARILASLKVLEDVPQLPSIDQQELGRIHWRNRTRRKGASVLSALAMRAANGTDAVELDRLALLASALGHHLTPANEGAELV